MDTVTANEQRHADKELAVAVGLDMAPWWRATASSDLQHVSQARLVEAVTEAISPEAAAALAPLKKGEAAARAEAMLDGRGWLPSVLRSPAR